MTKPTEDDRKRAGRNIDDAIAALVDVVRHEDETSNPDARYSAVVYKTAWKLCEALKAADAVFDYRIGTAHQEGGWAMTTADRAEYHAEIERLRQIGLTIDPATAETFFRWTDLADPYDLLDGKYHCGTVGRSWFARNPGGEWVYFSDLPDATREVLWKRDGRKLSFPYGLNPDDDVINRPPAAPKSKVNK